MSKSNPSKDLQSISDSVSKASIFAKSPVDEFTIVERSEGNYRSFVDIDTGVNVRNEFGRGDYDYFRAGEAVPERQKKLIQSCLNAYDKIGIVKNIIDLMGDFACKGIDITHPNPRVQAFYRYIFHNVWRGKDRTERFLNLLYKSGNVPVYQKTTKLQPKDVRQMQKVHGAADIDFKERVGEPVPKREIPIDFIFFNPVTVEVLGGELAKFAGLTKKYGIKIPTSLRREINKKGNEEIVAQLPKELVDFLRNSKNTLWPLPSEKISVYHYKKDDWQIWANPMLGSVLDDLIQYEKMKLADLSALDGAISNVRLWKLGNLEAGIPPTKEGVQRLSNLLTNNVGGGTIDIIWDPLIEFVESATQVYRFLGQEKYLPVWAAIYVGLGIPGALSGNNSSAGFTNNALSLKTLTERLEYGRNVVAQFWRTQLDVVGDALRGVPGFDTPAQLRFDHMVLSDEAAEKALFIRLAEQNMISLETLQERFGESFFLEKNRMKNESRQRESGKLPPQAGPYFSSQQEFDFKKIFAQSGLITPSELGIELQPKKKGEKAALDKQLTIKKSQQVKKKPAGKSGQGRPKTSKDKVKRKKKRVLPRTKGSLQLQVWASETQKAVGEITTDVYLKSVGKKNLRQLTVPEMYELENIKFSALFATKAFDAPQKIIDLALLKPVPDRVSVLYQGWLDENPKATVENIRAVQLSLFTNYLENENG